MSGQFLISPDRGSGAIARLLLADVSAQAAYGREGFPNQMASTAIKARSSWTAPRNSSTTQAISAERVWQRLWVLLLGLLIAFALLQAFVPLRTAVKIGADEDWELSKVTLALHGYHFYTEVWNDQPLLHTSIIKNVLKYLSPSVLGPRLVTSAFSILLVAGLFVICLRINGPLVATLAAAFLIASPGFMELSSSCMVEIPALAPAVAGLAVLVGSRLNNEATAETRRAQRTERLKNTLVLMSAGLFFGISFQIKFINVVLLPIVALIIWLQTRAAKSG